MDIVLSSSHQLVGTVTFLKYLSNDFLYSIVES
jgi:hypothetical protein